jgi:hypothetical protein
MEYIVEFGVFKNRLLAVGANLAGSALPIWLIIHKEMLLGTFTHIANEGWIKISNDPFWHGQSDQQGLS